MQPTLYDGDRVLAAQSPICQLVGIERGDVIIFRQGERRFIKRVTALPGDTVAALVGEPIRLASDEYYVMGDNRPLSLDSRSFGPVHAEEIIAKVVFRFK